MRFGPHSRTAAAAMSVLALGTVGLTALTSGATGAAGVRAQAANGTGYWLAGSDGGVFAFGTAQFYGSLAGRHLAAPITGIVPTTDDHGYWLTGKDGAVYPFGNATTQGSMAGKALAAPVVGIAATHAAGGTGATGPTGPAGPAGVTGATGARGSAGSNGTNGTNGQQGQRGLQGPPGAPNFAYIYNTSAQVVPVEGDVTFDSNNALSGFTHTAGTAGLTVLTSGIYRIEFSVSGVEPNQYTLMVNGFALAATFGSGAGTQQNEGHEIVTLGAGSVLTLQNHSSAAASTLQTLAGGTSTNVNAAVLVEQLADLVP